MEKFNDHWQKKKTIEKIFLLVVLGLAGVCGLILTILSLNPKFKLFGLSSKITLWLGVLMLIFGFLDFLLFCIPSKKERTENRRAKELKNNIKRIELEAQKMNSYKRSCLYCGTKLRDDEMVCPNCGVRTD